MSQHFFKSETSKGIPVLIQAGWDEPLQGFYMVIEHANAEKMSDIQLNTNNLIDGYLFSNLGINHTGESHPSSFEIFEEILRNYAIQIPIKMLNHIKQDKIDNQVDLVKHWN